MTTRIGGTVFSALSRRFAGLVFAVSMLGLATSAPVHAYTGGYINGGTSCGGCHGGASTATSVAVSSGNLGVQQGGQVTINIAVANNTGLLAGFNSAVYSNNAKVLIANLVADNRAKIGNFPGDGEVTHSQKPALANGVATFSYTWKTPPTATVGTTYTIKTVGLATQSGGVGAAQWNTGNDLTVTIVAPPTVPGAPSGASATAGNAQAAVSFTAPTQDGGTPITGYTVTALPGPVTATGTASPITITGLNNDVPYTFTVKANNSVGAGAASSASNSVTPAALSNVATGVSAVAGNTQATVNFTVPAAGFSGTYTVTAIPVSGSGQQNVIATGTSSPITVTGLTNNVSYIFTVAAGATASTASSSVMPNNGKFVPTSLSSPLSATAGNQMAIIVSTQPESDGGSPITAYNALCTYSLVQGVTLSFTATSPTPVIVITGLNNGTQYKCGLTATNAVGTSIPPAPANYNIQFTPTSPAAPSVPTAITAVPGNGQATISFTAPANDGGSTILDYTAYCKVAPIPSASAAIPDRTVTGSTSPLTVTGLTNGTAYDCWTTARNSVGTFNQFQFYPSAVRVTPAVTPVPAAPTGVSASASDGKALVSFTAPSSAGGSAIESYTVISSPHGYVATGASSPIQVSGLVNGTAYTFTVTAKNSFGTGTASAASTAVTPAAAIVSAPDSPNCCSFVDAGNGMGILAFDPPANNGSPITGYAAICSYQSGAGVTLSITATGTSSPLIITGLTNGTTYQCKLTATNAAGTSPVPTFATAQFTPFSPAPPSVPTSITASPGNTQASVSFVAPSNTGGSAILDYKASCRDSSGTFTATGTASPLTVTGLTNGTTYACWVTARNAQGTFNSLAYRSATVNVTPAPGGGLPAAPTGVSANLGAGNNIQVSWNAVSGATSYNVYMANATNVTKANYASLAGGHVHAGVTSPFTHASASPGTYYIVVTAVNGTGESAESTQVSVIVSAPVTLPGAPTSVSASAGSGQATVSFSAPSSNGGAAITSYMVTSSPGGLTASGSGSPLIVSGLTNGTAYTFTVTATNSAGASAASAPSSSVTPSASFAFTPTLAVGYNLLGNSLNTALDVMAVFGNQTSSVAGVTSNVASVWKWNPATGKWQFHSPQLSTAANATYASTNNFEVLTSIAPGEGYWVNANIAMNLPTQNGPAFNWTSLNFANLPSGFNLIADSRNLTPSQFNSLISPTPPSQGQVPVNNFSSMWVWDAANAKWYFYSPILENSGTQAAVKAYADGRSFLHFPDFNKKIDMGVGFWVNKF
ncbi:MAG: beta strand repeat-containing protein [Burkholderiales bacterium]